MDESIRRYIERALQLQESRTDAITPAELDEIAAEIGLSPADLQAVEAEIEDHVTRGRGYMDHGMWDDAIKELSESAALAPTRIDVVFDLARAHEARFRSTQFPDDRMEAEELARVCLEYDPDFQPAFEMLRRFDGKAAVGTAPPAASSTAGRSTQPNRGTVFIALGVLVALFVAGGVAAGLVFMGAPEPADPYEYPPVVEHPYDTIPPTAIPTPRPPPPGEIPIEYAAHEGAPKLVYRTRLSKLDVYPDSAFYKMQGELLNDGEMQFEKITMRLELFDESGQRVHANSVDILGTHEAAIRPGDRHVFNRLERASAGVRTAKITVEHFQGAASGTDFPPSPEIDVKWEVPKPPGFELVVRERRSSFSKSSFGMKGYHKVDWEIENTGPSPIRLLRLHYKPFTENGKAGEPKTFLATYSSQAPIEPGEIRLENTIAGLESYSRYELSIMEIN